MIAKHVSMRSLAKSSFASLAEYITDSQSKEHRLGAVRITNCDSAVLGLAIEEIAAVQAKNSRAKSDKTYHLILSFRPGEEPSDEVLKAIEERVCEGLGFGDHQRISAVHNDTDNLHIHIAINKIHPKKGTIHEPYYSHRTLADLCETMERDYQLEPDNHITHQRGAAGRAEDMERHSGIESLVGWVKRECLDELRAASTWEELHKALADNSLELKLRGNGFVVEADDGTTVRASTLSRDLSKPALEKKLGEFKASTTKQQKPVRAYKKAPVKSKINTTELYARYKKEQQNLTTARSDALASARRNRDRAVADARRANRLRRATIKVIRDRSVSKKLLYSQASTALKSKLEAIGKEYAKDRELLFQGFQRQTWADWLKSESLKGNDKALEAMRARKAAEGLKGRFVQGGGKHKPGHSPVLDTITKKGTIIYKGKTAVRDDGKRLQVSRRTDLEGLQAALKIAASKYGNRLTITGDAEFKAKVIHAAVEGRLPIAFVDPGMERRRQEMLSKKENENVGNERGRSVGSGDGSAGSRRTTNNHGDRGAGVGWGRVDSNGGGAGKPDVSRVGRNPPPESQHRLRNLSALGLVQLAPGSEVLLPGNVSNHLEQQGAKSDNKLRWDNFGAGVAEAASAAADKYIAEREAKRIKGFDITKHTRYNEGPGSLSFAGVRNVDGQGLALLKRDDEVMVLPVDQATVRRLSRVSIGDPVSVTPRGSVRTSKGRSR